MVNHAGSSKVIRFMRCVIADETYCLNMSRVRGIQRTEQFHQQQGAEGGVIGWYMSSAGKIPVLGFIDSMFTRFAARRRSPRFTSYVWLVLRKPAIPLGGAQGRT